MASPSQVDDAPASAEGSSVQGQEEGAVEVKAEHLRVSFFPWRSCDTFCEIKI